MGSYLGVAALVAVVLYVAYNRYYLPRVASPSGRSGDSFVLVYDGRDYVLHRAVWTSTGTLSIGDTEFPSAVVRPVHNTRGVDAVDLSVVALSPVSLTEHRTLEHSRRAIVLGSLFKPSSDLLEIGRWIAVAAVLACTFYVYSMIGTFGSNTAAQSVEIKRMADILSKPLAVEQVPAAAPPAPPAPPADPAAVPAPPADPAAVPAPSVAP